jgi:hypothetical protein
MALKARSESEPPMEERLARVESHVEHIQSDITEMKVNMRGIRQEIRDTRTELHQQQNRRRESCIGREDRWHERQTRRF